MPKLKARITITDLEGGNAPMSTSIIIDGASPLAAMARFSAAADTMPYKGPVTNEPAKGPDGKDS